MSERPEAGSARVFLVVNLLRVFFVACFVRLKRSTKKLTTCDDDWFIDQLANLLVEQAERSSLDALGADFSNEESVPGSSRTNLREGAISTSPEKLGLKRGDQITIPCAEC
jgi:hypothetical protein